ncbi:MAG: MraY family glycosyltransferase [Candidatus Acidiferrales bacterium]|jgi:UDP-GlcNAc:undecaprenyl-phosphate GlcNAc-1-phosphate transferase
MNFHSDLIAFAVALFASLSLTVPVRHLALRYGMVDKPGPRKVHLTPIPLLGGIAIYLGFVLAILLTLHGAPQQQIAGILAGATLLATVGFLDDSGLLHHQVKLFVGMPVAALFLLASGIRAQFFSAFIPGMAGTVLDGCFTVLWVVGITASFSILDHMDGLCAGIAAVAAGFFTLSASLNGQMLVRTLGAAALGAALGFLLWNFNPAKIFMGDGGAMFLGFLMATLGLKIRPEGMRFPASWLAPVLILGVPIFDTTLVSISRSRRGLLPFTSPGKDHTAHRLSNLGLGHRGAVVALYCLAALFGSVALIVPHVSYKVAYLLAGIMAVGGLIAIAFLEGAPYERQAKLAKPSAPS